MYLHTALFQDTSNCSFHSMYVLPLCMFACVFFCCVMSCRMYMLMYTQKTANRALTCTCTCHCTLTVQDWLPEEMLSCIIWWEASGSPREGNYYKAGYSREIMTVQAQYTTGATDILSLQRILLWFILWQRDRNWWQTNMHAVQREG